VSLSDILLKFNLSDDDLLIRKCIAQDKKAWDVFVDKYNRLIYGAIIKTINRYSYSADDQLVDDIFQMVFLSLIDHECKKLKQFKKKCKLSSWLHIIAVRTTIDYMKKKSIKFSIDGDSKQEKVLKEKLSDERSLPDEILIQEEKINIYESVKNRLNTKEKFFVELYYTRELSPDDVAKVMNIKTNNVYQIRKRVQEKMEHIASEFL
jgi:RNA polymerase sigma factor (sigma-70 family)